MGESVKEGEYKGRRVNEKCNLGGGGCGGRMQEGETDCAWRRRLYKGRRECEEEAESGVGGSEGSRKVHKARRRMM